jgi:hypothetical protein
LTESFLHYVWQFQYFDKKDLTTTKGEDILVSYPGMKNTHAGPDFSDAKILIGDLEWRGSVEIHIKASGWNDHHHGDDAAYENVVLHVVWENDKPIDRSDGSAMPTLELKNRVDLALWNKYKKLFTSADSIPCARSWYSVSDLVKLSMIDKAVTQRLETKANDVIAVLDKNQGDWDETCYQLLCRNFGFKVNNDPFFQLAQALPLKILLKHRNQPAQVEALLFGQAGFLEKDVKGDEYFRHLVREFNLLSKKHNLESKRLHKSQWRFLRLRPANFPTLRLSQLAALLQQKSNLFSTLLARVTYSELVEWLNVEQSAYWKTHYDFGKTSAHVSSIGKSSIENIVINTVTPMLAAYSMTHDDQQFMDRAVDLLQHLPAEKNKITRHWVELGYDVKTASDSQGLIELYNSFCLKRRCLECNVGSSLIRP